MKKYFIATFLLLSLSLSAAELTKETMVYSIKGNDTLKLDKYVVDTPRQDLRSCIIFMFGGGFFTGQRDHEQYIPFFDYYARKGYCVVSIDYRLGLKDGGLDNAKSVVALVTKLNNTINMAVEDLFDATNFVCNHAAEWGVDRRLIVASGSSAGAISVLQAEYNIANDTKLAKKLPQEFRYAGIISFAGSIFSTANKLEWKNAPSPILMFHGDADSNVPYNKMTILGRGFYGSKYIAQTLRKLNSPYYFSSFTDCAHEMATQPMNRNRYDIDEFMSAFVFRGQPLMIEKSTTNNSIPVKKKKFSIKDYVNSNFKPQ